MFVKNRFETFGEFGRLLNDADLDCFESFWVLPKNLVDEPNRRGDGWSIVSRHDLQLADGRSIGFYLKRQQNYFPRHVIRRTRPLLWREYRRLCDFSNWKVPALEVIAIGIRHSAEGCQGILATLALDDYRSLDQLMAQFRPNLPDQVLAAVAGAVGHMHSRHYFHGNLYPKHVYVSQTDPSSADSPAVRFIDLEDAVYLPVSNLGRVRDLEKLNRYSSDLSLFRRLRFFYRYLGVRRLDRKTRALLDSIVRRARSKNLKVRV